MLNFSGTQSCFSGIKNYPIWFSIFKFSNSQIFKFRQPCRMSKVYSLRTVQTIPVTLERAWEFFGTPDNLKDITPPNLGFTIKSQHHGKRMYAGQIIEYSVKPLFGIPLYWMTEITHVVEGQYFIDEQRFGPYSLWHHQHHFREVAGGIEMTDIVHYKIPFWFFGDIAHGLFVRRELKKIFEFRQYFIQQKFGAIS